MSRSGYAIHVGGVARCVLLLMGLGTAGAQAAGGGLTLQAGEDDNVTNVPGGVPELSSPYYELAAGIDWLPHAGQRTGLGVGLNGRARNVRQHDGLSHVGAGASLSGWLLLGGGFHSPAVYLDLGAGVRDFQSAERDQSHWTAGLSVVQRWTTRISGQLQAGLRSVDAEGGAWDGDQLSYGLGVAWQPLDWAALDLRYDEFDGDVPVSVDRFFNEVFSVSDFVQTDDALPGFLAYRVDSQGYTVNLGLDLHWTEHATVRIHGLWSDVESKRPLMMDDDGPGPDGPGPDDPGPGPDDPGPGPDDPGPGPDDPGPGPDGPGPGPGPDDGASGLDMYPSYERLITGVSLIVRF